MMSGLRSATSNETKITRNKLKNKTTNKIEKSKKTTMDSAKSSMI